MSSAAIRGSLHTCGTVTFSCLFLYLTSGIGRVAPFSFFRNNSDKCAFPQKLPTSFKKALLFASGENFLSAPQATKTHLFIMFEHVPISELCVMHLRAFVSDKFHGFLMFWNRLDPSIVLSDRDVEKRERLIQTYLIVFGLFLSYDHDLALQKVLMKYFILFLWFSLSYYLFLTRQTLGVGKFTYNTFALLISLVFCYAFVLCAYAFGNGSNWSFWDFLSIYGISTLIVALPLFV